MADRADYARENTAGKDRTENGTEPILQNQIVQVWMLDRSLDLQVCSMKHPGSNRKWLPEEETPYQAKLSVQKILGDHPVNTTESDLHHNIIKSAEHILVEKPVQLDLFEEILWM